MKVTPEALEAGAAAAQKMGFAITSFMVAPILEAAFSQMFPDVEVDAEDYRLRKLEATVNALAQTVQNIGAYVQANDPVIQSLKDGTFADAIGKPIVAEFTEATEEACRSELV